MFIKADLKTGDWIVKRGGDVEQVLLNTPFGNYTVKESGSNGLDSKNDNLTSKLGKEFDVMKVMRAKYPGYLGTSNSEHSTVVFDREKGIGCEKSKPQHEFEIGDKVRIVDSGKLYSSYPDFVATKAPTLKANYIDHGQPHSGATFKVIAAGDHLTFNDDYIYVIQDTVSLQVFVIGEKGLKAVAE